MNHSWSFQRKVAAGFGALVGLAAVTAAVAVYSLQAVVGDADRVASVNAECMAEAARLNAACDRQISAFRMFLMVPEDRFVQQWKDGQQEVLDSVGRLERLAFTEEGRRRLAGIRQKHSVLTMSQDQCFGLRKDKGFDAALRFLLTDTLGKRDALAVDTKQFVEREERLLQLASQESHRKANLALTSVIGLAIAAVFFAVIAAVFLSRTLSRQIGSAVQHVQNSSAELQSTANQQASGARETATSMNEVTTTMSELLVTSRQISESAQQVAHIAQETAKAAREGDETVGKMQESIEAIRRQVDIIVTHMLELGKKSQQIGGILDIINELAEQTNILSINATIEAAGAGEAGKRFGVVGDEIRKLADRVTGSTREIRALVEEIRAAVNTTVLATEGGSKAVDAGLRHFAEVTRGFKQITGMVVTTTEASREIELSTKQQMSAVEQVNTAITGAAQAARETEAGTTQTLQTATQLAHLSHDLSQIVQPHPA